MATSAQYGKRILLCPSSYYPAVGGVEELTRHIARVLKLRGYEVAIAVNSACASAGKTEDVVDDIPVFYFDFPYPHREIKGMARLPEIVSASKTFNSFVKEWAPDVVHLICASSNCLYVWLARFSARFKLILTLQGETFMDAHQLYQRSSFARWALKQVSGVADVITGCSNFVLEDGQKFLAGRAPRVRIFNGIELSERTHASRGALPLEDKFILGVGRLVENKGFDLLVEAFGKVAREFRDVDLVIAGDGPTRDSLAACARENAVAHRFHLVGIPKRADLLALYERCLFFVLPSPVEPFGIVALEAMRAGKPVIAFRSGGPPEFIQSGETGILVPNVNVFGLATAIRELLSEQEKREAMGQAARKAAATFDWSFLVDQYERLYSD